MLPGMWLLIHAGINFTQILQITSLALGNYSAHVSDVIPKNMGKQIIWIHKNCRYNQSKTNPSTIAPVPVKYPGRYE